MLIAFLSRETLTAELTETLGRLAPGYYEEDVSSLVDVVYWSSIAGLGLVVAIEAVLLAFVMNRRGGARWLQLPVLVLHTGVVLVASAFIAIGDWGAVVELLLLAGLVFAVVAWVLCLVPSAHRWFRMRDESQRRRRLRPARRQMTSASHVRVTTWQASTAPRSSSGLPAIARQRCRASAAVRCTSSGGASSGRPSRRVVDVPAPPISRSASAASAGGSPSPWCVPPRAG